MTIANNLTPPVSRDCHCISGVSIYFQSLSVKSGNTLYNVESWKVAINDGASLDIFAKGKSTPNYDREFDNLYTRAFLLEKHDAVFQKIFTKRDISSEVL